MQALKRRYYTIPIYRKVEGLDLKGGMGDHGNYQFSHNIKGFLQPRSGGISTANQSQVPLSSHVIYCDPGIDILNKDMFKLYDKSYILTFNQNDLGIGGVVDHQEIPAEYRNDIDLP